jgi:hypothetical protein
MVPTNYPVYPAILVRGLAKSEETDFTYHLFRKVKAITSEISDK